MELRKHLPLLALPLLSCLLMPGSLDAQDKAKPSLRPKPVVGASSIKQFPKLMVMAPTPKQQESLSKLSFARAYSLNAAQEQLDQPLRQSLRRYFSLDGCSYPQAGRDDVDFLPYPVSFVKVYSFCQPTAQPKLNACLQSLSFPGIKGKKKVLPVLMASSLKEAQALAKQRGFTGELHPLLVVGKSPDITRYIGETEKNLSALARLSEVAPLKPINAGTPGQRCQALRGKGLRPPELRYSRSLWINLPRQ